MKCEEVERAVFTTTRRGTEEVDDSRAPFDANSAGEEGQSSEGDEAEDEDGGVRLPCNMDPPTATATVKPPSVERAQKTPREWGMQKAKEREMVRRAARRGVAFGFETAEGKRRRVEAVQWGRVVESSFAKGEWGVRWRE